MYRLYLNDNHVSSFEDSKSFSVKDGLLLIIENETVNGFVLKPGDAFLVTGEN